MNAIYDIKNLPLIERNIERNEIYEYFLSRELKQTTHNYNNLIKVGIFLSTIVLNYVLYVLYYKYSHPFWFKQPVAHFHWFLSTYFSQHKKIKNDLREINLNYVERNNIDWIISHNFNTKKSTLLLKQLHNIVSNHYLREKQAIYSPTIENIQSYFTGHIEPFFLSTYSQNNNNGEKLLGCITARPIYLHNNQEKYNVFSRQHNKNYVHYVDYLTVVREARGKKLSPKLIQTMVHHIANNITPGPIILFKHEGISAPYKCFISYTMSLFDISKWNLTNIKKSLFLSTNTIKKYSLQKITNKNIDLLREILQSNFIKSRFNYYIHTYFDNIYELVKNNMFYIYTLWDNKIGIQDIFSLQSNKKTIYKKSLREIVEGHLQGIYIFQNPEMYMQNNDIFSQQQQKKGNLREKKSIKISKTAKPVDNYIQLYCSCFKETDDRINKINNELFTYYMVDCLREISLHLFETKHYNLKKLIIENISHNTIMTDILKKNFNNDTIDCKYYLYNAILRETACKDCFILL